MAKSSNYRVSRATSSRPERSDRLLREARLLRENLKRRKAQSRVRSSVPEKS